MKRVFIVTSSIEVNNILKFKGTTTRSFFNTQDRLFQTIETLKNIRQNDPHADIILIDSSTKKYNEILALGFTNLTYVLLQDLSPTIANIVRTHSNKSYCEATMLVEFFKHYKTKLKHYDFIIKLSGRYQIEPSSYSADNFAQSTVNNFFYKSPIEWGKDQYEHMGNLIPSELIVNERLTCFYTVVQGIGKNKLDQFEALMTLSAVASDTNGKMYHIDIEYILYYYMGLFKQIQDVITVPWKILGQCGITGRSLLY